MFLIFFKVNLNVFFFDVLFATKIIKERKKERKKRKQIKRGNPSCDHPCACQVEWLGVGFDACVAHPE